MKNIGKSLLWLYGFIANFITYIQGLEKTLDWLNGRFPELISYVIICINTILLVFLLFYIPLLLFIYATLPYRKTIGTHGIECKPFNLLRYKFLNKNGKLLKVVHRGIQLPEEWTGREQVITTTIVTDKKIFVPVIPKLYDYFNLRNGETMKFLVHYDKVYDKQ